MKLPCVHCLTDKEAQYGYHHCFDRIAFMRSGGKEAICSECGTRFKVDNKTAKTLRCPHCGAVIKKQKEHRSVLRTKAYYVVPAAVGRFQVLRWFLVDTYKKALQPAQYDYFEVAQIWFAPDGKQVIAERKRGSFYWIDSWSYNSSLEIRNRAESVLKTIVPYAVYNRGGISPELKRRGVTSNFHDMAPIDIVAFLLENPNAATLWKAGRYDVVSNFLSRNKPIGEVWPALKICLRHGYDIKDVSLWCDMVSNLQYLVKDLRNPHYVCPENLEAAHDKYQQLADKKRYREDMEKRRNEDTKWDNKYKAMKKPYFGLLISDGEISMKVLQSVEDFYLEGEAMHHCVYKMGYYKKPEVLILSATIAGKRIETVEVSLKSFKVVQSRAVCNGNSEYHKRIIELVNQNMNQIRKCAKKAA